MVSALNAGVGNFDMGFESRTFGCEHAKRERKYATCEHVDLMLCFTFLLTITVIRPVTK